MGAKGSKGPSEAEQRRILQLHTIQRGLTNSGQAVHFENLVFEGGGNKAVSYYGVLRIMEELGLLTSVRRYAGVGAGAGWAMFLSVGLKPTEVADLKLENELSYHANFGMFAFMPQLAQKLGWSPLGRAVKIAQRVMEQRTGKPNVTFREVYEQFGNELCIVATNLTTGSLEYFHPKTTPDIPIIDALVMSATLPGVMKPKYLVRGGQKHYFVDGGVLCNFPIHAFDGWYLSMKKEDSFLSRLSGQLDPPFKGYNDKTLGVVTVSPGDGEFGEQAFLRRLQYEGVMRPNTKLAKSKGAESESRFQRAVSQDQVQGAGQRLIQRLRNANIDGGAALTIEDFQRALGQTSGSGNVDDIELLFGQTRGELTQLFEQLNRERNGQVTFDEFVEVAQQQSSTFRQHIDGGGTSRNIRNMPDILRAVLSTVEGNSKRAFLKEIDIIRTIGVNTDYVASLDPLDTQDKTFLVLQGEAATLAFLLEYTQKYAPQEQMPIYSALPQRQNSIGGSVIDPDEIRDYTVPQNLYPTLPPSYESAIGDSDHLRESLHTNWPTPGELYPGLPGGYNYHPEKRPAHEMQFQQPPPQQQPPPPMHHMPPHMMMPPPQQPGHFVPQHPPPQPYLANPPPVTADPWDIPRGHRSGGARQQQVVVPQQHQVRVPQQQQQQQVMVPQQRVPLPSAAVAPQVVQQAQPAQTTTSFTVTIGQQNTGTGPAVISARPQQMIQQPQYSPQEHRVHRSHAQPQPQVFHQPVSPVMQRRPQQVQVTYPQVRQQQLPQARGHHHNQRRHHRNLARHEAEQADVNHVVYVS